MHALIGPRPPCRPCTRSLATSGSPQSLTCPTRQSLGCADVLSLRDRQAQLHLALRLDWSPKRLPSRKDACSKPSLPFCVQSRPSVKESPAHTNLGCRSLLVTRWGQARGRLRRRMMGQGHMQTGAQTVTWQMCRKACHVRSQRCHPTQDNAIMLQACSWLLSGTYLFHNLRRGPCLPASVCCRLSLVMPACQLDGHAWRQEAHVAHVCCRDIVCLACLSGPAAWLSNPGSLHAAPAQRRPKGVQQPFRSQTSVHTRQGQQLPTRDRSRGLQTTEESWLGGLWALLWPLPTGAGLSQPAGVKLRSR